MNPALEVGHFGGWRCARSPDTTVFFAWIALANSGLAEDRSKSEILQRHARYYMQLITPTDPRWGIRTLICEGDGWPGSSSFPGILGTLFRRSNPELSAQLMQLRKEGGSDLSGGMGMPDLLIVDPSLPTQPLPGSMLVSRHARAVAQCP